MPEKDLREEIRDELRLRVYQRYYGHLPEGTREVKVRKLYLVLAGEGCPGCEAAVEEYQKEIDAGNVEVVSSDDDKGLAIITALGFYALPALIAEDEEGDYVVVENAQ